MFQSEAIPTQIKDFLLFRKRRGVCVCDWFHTSIYFFPSTPFKHPSKSSLFFAQKMDGKKIIRNFVKWGRGGLHFIKWFHKKIFNFTNDAFPYASPRTGKVSINNPATIKKFLFTCNTHNNGAKLEIFNLTDIKTSIICGPGGGAGC